MNAIRKIIKREGNNLNVILPEDFKADRVELIILPFEGIAERDTSANDEVFRINLTRIFSKFNAELKGFKFNREDLYDRD